MRSAWDLEADHDLDWRLSAACRGEDPEMWSLAHDLVGRERNAAAKEICRHCPVKRECLEFGLRTNAVGMIFGGKNMGTRKRVASG